MFDLTYLITDTSNNVLTLILLILASFRIWMEIVNFNFLELPLTNKLKDIGGKNFAKSFHRVGLFFSVGYIIFFAPGYILA